ncbi:developmentally-regulated protein [Acrasis kona]|uniref:Developmentally-regulated protein n=1 Tax=Acrasis kona TaxID=1008807 RepID=A0AAW2ZSU7_9EUKA
MTKNRMTLKDLISSKDIPDDDLDASFRVPSDDDSSEDIEDEVEDSEEGEEVLNGIDEAVYEESDDEDAEDLIDRTAVIGNLGGNATEEDIVMHFRKLGVQDILDDRESSGIVAVRFVTIADRDRAVSDYHGSYLKGTKIEVSPWRILEDGQDDYDSDGSQAEVDSDGDDSDDEEDYSDSDDDDDQEDQPSKSRRIDQSDIDNVYEEMINLSTDQKETEDKIENIISVLCTFQDKLHRYKRRISSLENELDRSNGKIKELKRKLKHRGSEYSHKRNDYNKRSRKY